MTALKGCTIVELAEGVSGEYCGKLLADFGARVIKVERPGRGSPTRAMAPVVGSEDGFENSGLFAYLNTNKQSVALDLATAGARENLRTLLAAAQVVIDDHDEDWLKDVGLDPGQVQQSYPSLVLCSITPFGYGAPRDWRNAKSLNVFHVSGWGYHTPTRADITKPPLKGPGRFLSDFEAALDAAIGILSALYWRGRTGQGQVVDLAQLDVLVSRADTVLGRFIAGDDEVTTARSAYDQGGPHGFFACADGAVYLYMTSRAHWEGFKAVMGNPDWAEQFDPDWLEFGAYEDRVAECRARFAEWVRPLKKDDVSAEAQRLGVPLVSVNDASDVQNSPQYQFREFFQNLNHPILGEAQYPTVPYRLSASPARLVQPAPALGQHTRAVLSEKPPEGTAAAPSSGGVAGVNTSRGGPLAGVRVLELTKVWAGPYAGKLLAFLGAEVIKVESNLNLDEMRAYGGVDINNAPYFTSLNPEVLSVQLNLKSEEGLKLLRDMVAKSDIVLNNLRPGAMERSGLGYEDLRKIKKDIISVSIKMYGNDGPLGYQTGYAPCFAALGGLNYLVGHEGEPPAGINMRYGDSTVGTNAALAALVALMHRERTGEGQFVDVSAVECMSSMIGDSLLEYSLTGQAPAPDGNRHADMAPHGCYPCRDDAWLSIAVSSDQEWRALCEGLDLPQLAGESQFATLAARQENRRRLDDLLAGHTRKLDAEDLAARLRAKGVPAFKSKNTLDLTTEDYLWQREVFQFVKNCRNTDRPIVGSPWRMSGTNATITRGAPDLGEHNAYVYCDILGLSTEMLENLIRREIVK